MVKLSAQNAFIKSVWEDAWRYMMSGNKGGIRVLRNPPLWPKRISYMRLFWQAYRDILRRVTSGENPADMHWDNWNIQPDPDPVPDTPSSGNCDFQVVTL